jgi:formylglycine-generating enzyme required for sulfatase activity
MGRERPRHQIRIANGFWMGKTEVTQRAYERVMGTNPSRYPGALHPVEQVDWQSARTYCSAVGMRLPTESEWEFAAAGGVDAARYGPLDSIAWYDPNSGDSTHDVALKAPNSYGLFDMLGNVWEWVEDESNVDPRRKIMKGGSFYNIARDLRMPNRETPVESLRHRNVGFRCVAN